MKKSLTLSAALVTLSLLSVGAYAQTTKATETAKPMDHDMKKMEKPMGGKMMDGKMMGGRMMRGPAMSEEGRKMMQDAMTKFNEEHKAHFDEMKAKKDELKEILKSATFDKNAYLAKEAEIQTLMQKVHTARTETMADVAAKLKPEDRAMMGQRGGFHRGMMGKGYDKMDGPAMGDRPAMGGGNQ